MNYSTIEEIMDGIKAFFEANFNAAVAEANARAQAKNPQKPLAPAIKKFTLGPVPTPSPGLNINLDNWSDADSGQCSNKLTLFISVNVVIDMSTSAKIGPVLMRYADALRNFVNEHYALGGVVESSIIENGDKLEEPNSGNGFLLTTLVVTIESTTN